MTKEEHCKRHKELHIAVDELLADYLQHNPKSPGGIGVLELLVWSYDQCTAPVGKHTYPTLTFTKIAVEYLTNLRKRTEPR